MPPLNNLCAGKPAAPARAAQQDLYLVSDGARIRYRDEGQGPAVLMVHGWTLDLEMWDPQVADLCNTFRIVRFDRRGFGLSSGRPDATTDTLDIRRLCEHLGITRVALVGMSQGARTVLGVAGVVPQMIWCLVLDGPPSIDPEPSTAEAAIPLDYFRTLMRTQGIGAVRREWAAHPLVSLRTADPRWRALLAAMLRRYPGNDLMSPTSTPDAQAAALSVETPQLPLLVITGEHEPAPRALAADELAARSPGAERVVISAAGHLPNLDNPLEYNASLRGFLQRHAPPFR
jgi:3-oxoadipate enol-lactonase